MRPPAASASSGAVPWVPTTGTPPRTWPLASPRRSRTASGWCWRSLTRRLRPTRSAQHGECSSGHWPRFLANLWQMALTAEREDALCLVELRGFEPLTPCMPSRDPHHGTHTKPCVAGRFNAPRRLVRGGSCGFVVQSCCAAAARNRVAGAPSGSVKAITAASKWCDS
jgi:hypothetical protein